MRGKTLIGISLGLLIGIFPPPSWGQEITIENFYAYPNPFYSETTLRIVVEFTGGTQPALATLEVYDQAGDLTAVIIKETQVYPDIPSTFNWDGKDSDGDFPLAGGYVLRLQLNFPSTETKSAFYKIVYLGERI